MEKKENFIGLVIEENATDANRLERGLERIAAALKNVSNLYKETLGEFSKEILIDMLENRTKNIQDKILRELEEQLRKSGFTIPSYIESQKQSAIQALFPLGDAVRVLVDIYEKEVQRQTMPVDILSFINDEGVLVIDNSVRTRIFEIFNISIRNNVQNDFYCDFLELKRSVDKFVKRCKDKGIDIYKLAHEYDANSLFFIDNNKLTITINPYVIPGIK